MSNRTHTIAERIRNNQPLPPLVGAVLHAASLGQRAGMWLRLQRVPVHVPARVISYGNLTAGGVGKTPAVMERALQELDAGRRVAVLTRGYGAEREPEPIVRPPHSDFPNAAHRLGDEAALIARRIPAVCIVRSADRVAGARAAIEQGCDTLIMDDGFQAVALARNENILLIDATNPFGNGYRVPRGILREVPAAMKRATEIVLTRCDQAQRALPELEATIRRYAPGTPIRRTCHTPVALWRISDNGEMPLTEIEKTPVRAVCGIGNPAAFLQTLRAIGANVAESHCLPDHGAIPHVLFDTALSVIITEKDAMRLDVPPPANVYALIVRIVPMPEDGFQTA